MRHYLTVSLFLVALLGFISAVIAALGMASPVVLADLPTQTLMGPTTRTTLLNLFFLGCAITTLSHLLSERLTPAPLANPLQKLR